MKSWRLSRRRGWAVAMATLALLGCLTAGFLWREHVTGRRAFEAWREELKQAGIGLTHDELPDVFSTPAGCTILPVEEINRLLAVRPPVWRSAGRTGWLTPQERVTSRHAVPAWTQASARFDDGSTAGWEETRAAFANTFLDLTPLDDLLKAGPAACEFDPSNPDSQLPTRFAFIEAMRHFSTRAILELQAGQADECLETVRAAIRLSQTTVAFPLTITYLGHQAVASLLNCHLWSVLQYPGWTEAQLAVLQEEWRAADPLPLLPRMVQGERAVGLVLIDHMPRLILASRQGRETPARVYSSAFSPFRPAEALERIEQTIRNRTRRSGIAVARMAWADHNRLAYCRPMQTYLEAANLLLDKRNLQPVQALLEAHQDELRPAPPRATKSRIAFARTLANTLFLPRLTDVIEQVAALATRREIVITAIALRRFHLIHDEWPPTLDHLVPDFLPAVPHDWMDGQPLRYRPETAHSFLLYSVGEDGRDDGGECGDWPARFGSEMLAGKDWVWPMPAVE